MPSKKNDDQGGPFTLEAQRTASEGLARPEVIERVKRHLSQLGLPHFAIKGVLFVDDAWIASRIEGEDYQRVTVPEVIDHLKETWVDRGVAETIGTMYSPCDERPHCVIAPYT